MNRYDLQITKTVVHSYEAATYIEAVLAAEFDLSTGEMTGSFEKASAEISDVHAETPAVPAQMAPSTKADALAMLNVALHSAKTTGLLQAIERKCGHSCGTAFWRAVGEICVEDSAGTTQAEDAGAVAKAKVGPRPASRFEVRYVNLDRNGIGKPGPALRCLDVANALAVSKGREEFRRLLMDAFPTLDGRKFPQGKPPFGDLWIFKQNVLSLLRGVGPTLAKDPVAFGKVPALMAEIEAIPNDPMCKCQTGPEWSGSPNPANPDHQWVCDDCDQVINV